MVCAFSEYCSSKHEVETVEVIYPDGTKYDVPDLKYRTEIISSKRATNYVGIKQVFEHSLEFLIFICCAAIFNLLLVEHFSQSPKEVAKLLTKMSLQTKVVNDDELQVQIPPTRRDVIHACDIYEDVAIGYGYNNIKKTVPKTPSIGKEVNYLLVL